MKLDRTTISYLAIIGVVIAVVVSIALSSLNDSNLSGEADGTDISRIQGSDENNPYADLDGSPVSLSQYEGKVLVINAWASWCPFCVEELSDFAELGREYADKDVVVIAINRSEPANTAKAFLNSVGNPEDIVFLLNSSDSFYRSIGGFSMPETQFYSKNGELTAHKRGFMELSEMRGFVEEALAVTNQ